MEIGSIRHKPLRRFVETGRPKGLDANVARFRTVLKGFDYIPDERYAAYKDGDKVSAARVVCGAVACVPWRLEAVERQLVGNSRNEELATRAAKLAVEGARTLNFNHFKIPLMENLVRRAIRDA